MEKATIDLKRSTYEELLYYSKILNTPPETLTEKALEALFLEMSKQLAQNSSFDDNAQTNLSYDEFWDGVDI